MIRKKRQEDLNENHWCKQIFWENMYFFKLGKMIDFWWKKTFIYAGRKIALQKEKKKGKICIENWKFDLDHWKKQLSNAATV